MKTGSKKIITVLSDGPHIPTGYSNQMKQLVQNFTKNGHTVHWLSNGYNGATLDGIKLDDGTRIDCKIYGTMQQDYFRNQISQHLKETKSDIFIILLDTFMLYPWLVDVDLSPAKSFFYFPSDGGGGIPKGCESILKKVDVPVSMAEFGQKQVGDYYKIDAKHIPHGCDTKRFYPLPEEERNKLREENGFKDKFVIGVVARNQPRKHLDRTIKSMKLISKKIPEAILFLHLDPNDLANPMFKIHNLVEKYGLENRVIYSGMQAHKGVGWDKMNGIYNMMDVFLLTTSGEGFGIPIIEAMACEVPVVATDYTSTPELVINNKAGLGIKLSGVDTTEMPLTLVNYKLGEDTGISPARKVNTMQEYDEACFNGTMTGSWEVERGFCDIKDCADKIQMLYNYPMMRKDMGINGRNAVLEKYDFDLVAKQWEKLINEM